MANTNKPLITGPKTFSINMDKPNNDTCVAVFAVQQVLGRPIKKYNLVIETEDGTHFSSSDTRLDKEMIQYIRNADKDDKFNWTLGYLIKSQLHEENHKDDGVKFYTLLCLADADCGKFGKLKNDQFAFFGMKDLE